MRDPFRVLIATVRAQLPSEIDAADLHAFLAVNGPVLRQELSRAVGAIPPPSPAPLVPPGSNLWDHFHHQGAPGPGERGWRPALNNEDTAEDILDTAIRYLEEPELFWMWQATRIAAGAAWAVWEDEGGDPDELPDLLGVPTRLSQERRWEVGLGAVQLAMEVEGRALARGEEHLPDGRLPKWVAVGVLADRLDVDAPMRLVNVDRATAAAFIERHHSSLPCINLRGIMYGLGVKVGGRLVAVATAGHPTGRWSRVDPRNVLELTRLASDGSTKNAASMLVARLLDLRGRSRRGRPDEPALLITYQLSEAEGAVYRALQDKGLRAVARVPGRKPGGARRAGRLSPCQRRTGVVSSLGEMDKIRWEAG